MTTTKEVPLADLASVYTGKLLADIGGVYEVIDFMTGSAHLTHQLPRAAEAIRPHLAKQFPWLTDLDASEVHDPATAVRYLRKIEQTYGPTHVVRALEEGQYTRVDPIKELKQMAPHATIVAVEMPSQGPSLDG